MANTAPTPPLSTPPTIVDTARTMVVLREAAQVYLATDRPGSAQLAYDESEHARAYVMDALGRLFASGANA